MCRSYPIPELICMNSFRDGKKQQSIVQGTEKDKPNVRSTYSHTRALWRHHAKKRRTWRCKQTLTEPKTIHLILSWLYILLIPPATDHYRHSVTAVDKSKGVDLHTSFRYKTAEIRDEEKMFRSFFLKKISFVGVHFPRNSRASRAYCTTPPQVS